MRSEVDWNAVLAAHGGQVGSVVGGAAAPKASRTAPGNSQAAEEEGDSEADDSEPEFLTVGLIGAHVVPWRGPLTSANCAPRFSHPGQPNVGKSSLLNALFGTQKVRASRTPGKVRGLWGCRHIFRC